MRHYVYRITNTLNGKFYVGVHSCKKDFLNGNYYGSGQLIKKAILKYGKDKFNREVVQEFCSRDEARLYESVLVNEEFIKDDNTYNLAIGGDAGSLGCRHTDEAKQKIADASQGRSLSDESRQQISQKLLGRKHSEESKQKMSEALSGENSPNFGKKYSKEHVEKMRKSQTGLKRSDKAKDNMRKAQMGNSNASGGKGIPRKRRKVVCPHCNKEGDQSLMKRYHFDNCKYKGEQ